MSIGLGLPVDVPFLYNIFPAKCLLINPGKHIVIVSFAYVTFGNAKGKR